MPFPGTYLVCPLSIASKAAFLILAGVSKSGSPAAKTKTSLPSALNALALTLIPTVIEGLILFNLEAIKLIILNYIMFHN